MLQNKELHRVMSILSPFWSYPKRSRFLDFFENLPILAPKSKSSQFLNFSPEEKKKKNKKRFSNKYR